MEGVIIDALNEFQEAIKEIEAIKRKLKHLETTTDPEVIDSHIKAIAGLIHSFYTGCEKVLKILIYGYDGNIPAGEDWHRRLLLRAKNPLKEIRPAIISEKTYLHLDELRAFRHVFRGIYHSNLVPERILERAKLAIRLSELFRKDMENFMRHQGRQFPETKRMGE